MTREEAHKLIDQIYDIEDGGKEIVGTALEAPVEKRELPKDKRVVRTKSSGDRVYFIDEIKKTRQWVTNPEVLESLGFEISDVTEVEDSELLRYQMGSALYKVDGNS